MPGHDLSARVGCRKCRSQSKHAIVLVDHPRFHRICMRCGEIDPALASMCRGDPILPQSLFSASEEKAAGLDETDQDTTDTDPKPLCKALHASKSLQDSFVIVPAEGYHKLHLFADCFQCKGRDLFKRPICKDCTLKFIKKNR